MQIKNGSKACGLLKRKIDGVPGNGENGRKREILQVIPFQKGCTSTLQAAISWRKMR